MPLRSVTGYIANFTARTQPCNVCVNKPKGFSDWVRANEWIEQKTLAKALKPSQGLCSSPTKSISVLLDERQIYPPGSADQPGLVNPERSRLIAVVLDGDSLQQPPGRIQIVLRNSDSL